MLGLWAQPRCGLSCRIGYKGLGFGGSGFRVQGLGFRAQDLGFKAKTIKDSGFGEPCRS